MFVYIADKVYTVITVPTLNSLRYRGFIPFLGQVFLHHSALYKKTSMPAVPHLAKL